MANSNGWGDGAANNSIGWGQGANNNIGWGDSHAKSWAGATDIVGIDADATAFLTASAITGATQQAAIDNLVKGLKSDGIWSKMKAVYPFVTDNRNLLSYTEDFSNAYWQKQNCNITTDAIIAPNGTMTADKMSDSTTANTYRQTRILSTMSITTATTYTFSAYLKAGERNWAYLNIEGGTIGIGSNFNLSTGTIGTFTIGTTATITSIGNGWYRCTVSGNIGTGNIYPVIYTMNGDGVFNYVGVVGNGIYLWGAQLELGSTATTYQPIATTQQAFISSQFKFNLVNPVDSDAAFRLVFNGGWTHSSTGATPNGTNGYADTFLTPSSVLSLNSTHLSYYSRTNVIGSQAEMGVGSINPCYILFNYNGLAYAGLNGTEGFRASAANPTTGLLIGSRIVNTEEKYYTNNVSQTRTHLSTVIPSLKVFLGAYNPNNIAANLFSSKQAAFASIGNGLTDTEAANLYTRVQAFQTSLSRQV